MRLQTTISGSKRRFSFPSLIRGKGKAFKENSKRRNCLIIENFLRRVSEADSGARWLSCGCHQGSGDCHLHSSAFPAVESQLSRAMMWMESVRLRFGESGPSLVMLTLRLCSLSWFWGYVVVHRLSWLSQEAATFLDSCSWQTLPRKSQTTLQIDGFVIGFTAVR